MQIRLAAVTVALVIMMGCNQDDSGLVWNQFNDGADEIEVAITKGEPGPAIFGDLTSTTGEAFIGDVRIDPGSGPVGTEHQVVATVANAYEDRVLRVDLVIDSGVRGAVSFDMVQDSADAGIWVLDLRTYGVEGETRTDVLRFELYELVEELPDKTTE